MKNNSKTKKNFNSYRSSIELKCDLKRLEDLKKTIDTIIDQISIFDNKKEKEINLLKNKICDLTSKENYVEDEKSKELIRTAHDRIEAKKELYDRRKRILEKQLQQFKDSYNSLYSKEIKVKCSDLKEELEKITGKNIYVNLSIGILSYNYVNLHKIIKENKDKTIFMDMTICDKENPDYRKELNSMLYTKRFPIEFNEEQYDNNYLEEHINLKYGLTEDAKKYTSLDIDDNSDIVIKIKLGELTKEEENWKPVNLIREAVCKCKDREYKRSIGNIKEKVKRI